MFESVKHSIYKLAEETIHCPRKCEGVFSDVNGGILPRGLYFEERNENKIGCSIIGINPGSACEAEKRSYNAATTYKEMDALWNDRIKSFSYFRRAVNVADNLGITGSIIWTDLVKCTSSQGTKTIPEQTFRNCSDLFLKRELDLIPLNWPIFALGRVTYSRLKKSQLDRAIIGIYHPYSAYNSGYFKKMAEILEEAHLTYLELLYNGGEKEVWLSDYLNSKFKRK